MTDRGRVTDVEDDVFTVVIEVDHVEVYVDVETRYLPDVTVADIVDLHSDHVTRVDLGTWTQEQLDKIHRRARERYESVKKNFD